PGPGRHAGEWLFVPEGRDHADDAGWLLTFMHDDAEDRSELVIVDASDVRRGPVARIATPQRVPYGFHAAWVPACARTRERQGSPKRGRALRSIVSDIC